eukprot:scaffold180_cov311-Pinguiococcus_pyrenoidosus.AAC.37
MAAAFPSATLAGAERDYARPVVAERGSWEGKAALRYERKARNFCRSGGKGFLFLDCKWIGCNSTEN